MYTQKMYSADRKYLLDKIKYYRSKLDDYALEGYDYLLDDNTQWIHERIKTHQELLVIARNRYYYPDYQERSADNNRPFNWR